MDVTFSSKPIRGPMRGILLLIRENLRLGSGSD